MSSYIKASMERSYAESFVSELERNDNQYFLFIGKATSWENDNSPPEYTDSIESEYQIMNDAIAYKKLSPENVLFAIPRNDWVAGTIYDEYDDSIPLFDETDPKFFYVITDENHVYKCLSNNSSRQSSVKPSLVISTPFVTEDGYRWQYLATIKESNLPYELSDYVPIDLANSTDTESTNQYNTQVESVNASITRMNLVNAPGSSAGIYPNSIHRNANSIVVLSVGSFSVDANIPTKKYVTITDLDSRNRITNTLPLGESTQNYIGCVMRVNASTVNPKEINNYGIITGISLPGQPGTNPNEIVFAVENDVIDFTVTPTTNAQAYSSVQILPYIKIMGDGTGAYAFAEMNSNKTMRSVLLVNGGRNYSNVQVQVTSHKTEGTVHPTITAVRSPKGGHGSNILRELNVKNVIIVIKINEYDDREIVSGGSYRQFGIIKNPVLNDGSGNIAGKELFNFRDMTFVAPDGLHERGDFDLGSGSLILGSESYSSAKPVYVKSLTNTGVVVKTINSSGNFITRQDRINDYDLVIGSSTAQFSVGETVRQTIPSGTIIAGISYGFQVEVTGRVQQYSSGLLSVRLLGGENFLSGYSIFGDLSGAQSTVTSVTPSFGEYVWLTKTNGEIGSFLSFRSRGPNTNQKFYRVSDVSQPYFDLDNTPSYSGLTVLEIASSVSLSVGGMDTTSAPVIRTAFSNGQFIQQGISGGVGHYASGTVYHWEYINASRGRLYMTNVLGKFRSRQSHPDYNGIALSSYLIASVHEPEIDKTSGDVLYISNVRPVPRVMGQEEEFRLRLGF